MNNLTSELRGAKPRYCYCTKVFLVKFSSDIDLALYITAQKTLSKRDADYRQFLRSIGFSESEINDKGQDIRTRIKAVAANRQGGTNSNPEVLFF